MKLDRTLIDKEGVPTREEIKVYHEKNDITVAGSLYDPDDASDIKTAMFVKARGFMRKAWLEEMKKLGGKSSFKNFSTNYPPMLLAVTDENLIAGKVGDIFEDEEQISMYLDVGLNILEEPIMTALTAYASSANKAPEELTDDEIHKVVDMVATEFLNVMTATLMDAQKVPELLAGSKEMSDSEDFNTATQNNYSKMDHDKAWNHTDTDVGAILSFDEIKDDPDTNFEPIVNAFDKTGVYGETQIIDGIEEVEYQKFINEFILTLNEKNRKVFLLRAQGLTQAEIAKEIECENHSAISKRLKRIYQDYEEFKKEYQKRKR